MGGKHKQAQRTKNNVRPSSSGRSAELLANTLPQFVGFPSMKDAGFSLTNFTLNTMDDIDSTVDSNFQLVLKKMNKKDSTTKLKALQEFIDLVKGADQEAVKTILPFWTRLYIVLATDAEHKVREATHVAHHQVVIKAKRNLAPYLKQLAGPWFTSQYDTYAPAASSATKSFEDAFPPSKLQEAIIFCQEEILNYICDNLTVHTAQSLNNPKITTEDAEAKYERVVISSLQGYALYLNKVSSESIKKIEELNIKIISNTKFWKLSKNKVAPIRAAWFGVMTSLCCKAPFLLANEVGHVSSAIFTNLDESEPTVLPNVWEAALLTVTVLDKWWVHINIEKLLLPKLFRVLREGGQGNAAVIYPNLLPLLSHLPPNLDLNTFYFNFFDSMRTGLKQKNVLTSRSEFATVSLTLIECLQYVVLKNQTDVGLCEKLVKTQLIPTIEWCLICGQNSYKSLFNQIAALIQYWHRNRDHSDVSNYHRYLKYFWSNVDSLFQGLLMNLEHNYERGAVSDLATRQIEFLLSLKHMVKPKRSLKVKFSTETQLDSGDVSSSINTNEKFDEIYLAALNNLVYKTCESYVKFIKERQSKELIEHLFSLLQSFETADFFKSLSRTLSANSESEELIDLYDKLLGKWLKSSYLSSKFVVDLVFLLFKYLKTEEKQKILNSFTQLPNEHFGWCLARSLSHPHNADLTVQKWLSNEKVDKFLVTIVEKELLDESSPDLGLLLKQVFTESNNGELFISRQAVIQIIDLITSCLLTPSEYSVTLDSCASLAAYIASVLYTDTLQLTYGSELLLALFSLSCNSDLNMETITKDTLWEVNTAWQDAVAVLSCEMQIAEFTSLTKQFANIIEKELLDNSVDKFDFQKIIDAIVNFIRTGCKKRLLLEDFLLDLFLIHNFVTNWRTTLTDLCIHAEYINGNLSSPHEALEKGLENIDNDDVLKFFIWSYVTVSVLLTPLEDIEDSEDEDSSTPPNINTIVKLTSNINKYILNVLYDLALAQSFTDNFKMVKHFPKIAEVKVFLQDKGKMLLDGLHPAEKSGLEIELIDNIATKHCLWAKVGFALKSDIMEESPSDVYVTWLRCKQLQGEKNLGRLQMTQTFAGKLSFNDVMKMSDLQESLVILRCLPYSNELTPQFTENFNKIAKAPLVEKYYKLNFSYWEDCEFVIEIIRLCSVIIRNNGAETFPSPLMWDFITVSLASWSNSLVQVKHLYRNIQIISFMSAVLELFSAVEFYIKNLVSAVPNSKFVNEWIDVFAQEIHSNIVNMWLYFAEEFMQHADTHNTYLLLLRSFDSAVNCIKHVYIFKNPSSEMPSWSRLLKVSCLLLTNSLSTLQIWGYRMLMVLIPGLIEIDTLAVNTNTPHAKGLIIEQFKGLLVQTQDIVQTMLQDFKLGEDSCRVEAFTDSYVYTFAYLLCWDVLLNLCEKSSTELRYQYADWLRNQDFLNNLLNNIFKLMPAEVLHYNESKTKPFYEYFLTKLDLSLKDPNNSEVIEHMVCWVYAATVSQLPASVRQWWSGTETRTAQIVERVTSAYVSPQLCSQELADVAQHETKFKNMVVKVHPTVREVVAVYTVDEAQMDLVITLPTNYPLGGPDVQCNKQIGGTSHKQWIMQLKMCVLHQNGRIWDGLSLWNNNLDKKFDGVEECYICFAVLHPGTYQLPKLSCQTCRKKFHSACLYKWFSTSNKSTCPICRNLF